MASRLLWLFCGLLIGADLSQSVCVRQACPSGWTQYGSFCYLFQNTEMDWASAERYCISQQGNLASIQSNAVYTFLTNLIYSSASSHKRTWVGGHDAVKDGVWLWSDGSRFTFSSWAKGEPNNNGGRESCMEMNLRGQYSANDERCRSRRSFICQRRVQ